MYTEVVFDLYNKNWQSFKRIRLLFYRFAIKSLWRKQDYSAMKKYTVMRGPIYVMSVASLSFW